VMQAQRAGHPHTFVNVGRQSTARMEPQPVAQAWLLMFILP